MAQDDDRCRQLYVIRSGSIRSPKCTTGPGVSAGSTLHAIQASAAPVAVARHGYAKARRIGMCAMVGGKRKTEIRNATPALFRDMLLAMARSATSRKGPPS